MQTFFLPRRYAPSKAPVIGYASAGTPLEAAPYHQRQRLPIPPPFRRYDMAAMQVSGDSMTLEDGTGLTDGSWVLADRRLILSDYGYAYLFRLSDGSHVVKRLRLHIGRPAMFSDNKAYAPVQLDSGIRNVGQVYAFSPDGCIWKPVGYKSWN